MKMYKGILRLRDMSGFGWDDKTQTVTASEDTWERLAKTVRFSLRNTCSCTPCG